MLPLLKKLLNVAKSSRGRSVRITIEIEVSINGKRHRYTKHLFSFQESVKYLNRLNSQLNQLNKIESFSEKDIEKLDTIEPIFLKDGKSVSGDDDIEILKVIYSDSFNNKFEFDDFRSILKISPIKALKRAKR